ncbi:hypothetical protein [Nostoc favosum]|uniref:Uncharacterized protein n=1 Tax=Nostoc favosum CHAB5714 TaxID=2780399 RepID=A0ABS8IA52_9NOSO|nr:hypothetical protein [Nostoc favosum]MCC5600978.1 hypothetical protein [Nostoc favosum CHAB5714]
MRNFSYVGVARRRHRNTSTSQIINCFTDLSSLQLSHNSLDNLLSDFLNIVTRSSNMSNYSRTGSLAIATDHTAACNAINDNSKL